MIKTILLCLGFLLATTVFTQENNQQLFKVNDSEITNNAYSGMQWDTSKDLDHITLAVDQENSNNLASIDLGSTNQGLLLNRLTPEEINILEMSLGINEEGLMIYNILEASVQTWNGVKWICFGGNRDMLTTKYQKHKDAQNLKGAILNGNTLTISSENGNSVSVDLSPVLSSYDERIRRLEEMLLNSVTPVNEETHMNIDASLFQNAPNPVDGTSTIGYFIPKSVESAEIIVSNSMGQIIVTSELQERGANGQVTVEMDILETGVYYYTLFVDKEVVETKKMIVR